MREPGAGWACAATSVEKDRIAAWIQRCDLNFMRMFLVPELPAIAVGRLGRGNSSSGANGTTLLINLSTSQQAVQYFELRCLRCKALGYAKSVAGI